MQKSGNTQKNSTQLIIVIYLLPSKPTISRRPTINTSTVTVRLVTTSIATVSIVPIGRVTALTKNVPTKLRRNFLSCPEGRRPNNVAARVLEVVFTLSRWPRAMWWSADRNDILYSGVKSKSGAAAFLARFWPLLGPGWGQGWGQG